MENIPLWMKGKSEEEINSLMELRERAFPKTRKENKMKLTIEELENTQECAICGGYYPEIMMIEFADDSTRSYGGVKFMCKECDL